MIRHVFIAALFLILFLSGKSQAPVANFSQTNTSGCAPLVVTFKDESTGNPQSRNWDFGNGQLSTDPNPTVYYGSPGVYTVRLVVRNADGTDGITKTDLISVFPSPYVDFKVDYNTACAPMTIQFTDLSVAQQGSITSWKWDFGDGTSSTSPNPSKTFTNTGYYNISLTVGTSTGCQSTASKNRFIRIVSGITPKFDFNRVGTCTLPVVANFINQTTGPGSLSYSWNFGDGQTSTIKNPSNSYSALGTYSVKLSVQSNLGCKAEITTPITFGTTTTQIGAPDSSCPNKPINFTNTSTPAPISSTWDFGDGSPGSTQLNPVKSYTTPGIYTVTLTSKYAQCTGTITKQIKITNPPLADFTSPNPIGCKLPYTVNFQNTTPGAVSYLWNFGDGATSTEAAPAHTYTRAGDFNVTLSVVTGTGCPAVVFKSSFVKITTNFYVGINGVPNQGCKPYKFSPTANVISIDPVASYLWTFGDGGTSTSATPTYTYNSTGNFDVQLKVTTQGGCVDSVIAPKALLIGDSNAVNFTYTPTASVCAGTPFVFNSTTPNATIWNWDFGDGEGSSVKDPTHQFEDTGSNIIVTLTAISNGCAGRAMKVIPRLIGPVAKFKTTIPNCASRLQVLFLNQSLVDPSEAAGAVYTWNFGASSSPASFVGKDPPLVTYPAKGVYQVTLSITGVACPYTISKAVDLDPEIADFSLTKAQVCRYEPFKISVNTKTVDTSQIESYQWQIGSGAPFMGKWFVDTSLASIQNSPITLIIKDTFGCTLPPNTIPFSVAGVAADFAVTNNGGCVNTDVQFTDQSNPTGKINNWKFNFGDAKETSFTAPPFTHRYIDSGYYDVILYTNDSFGCTDTVFKKSAVHITRSIANFGADQTLFCQGGLLQFRDSSFGAGLNYSWNFGDGGVSTASNPTHIYTGADSTYSIKLKVTDAVGCTDSLIRSNYIRVVKPKTAFTATDTVTICPPLQTFFISQSKDYDSLAWDFGDGNTSTLDTISNFYNGYGNFNAKLYTYGYGGGCVDSASKVIHVYNPYIDTKLDYGPLVACNNLTVNFNITTPSNTRFYFFAGDGYIDSSQNKTFSHYYKAPNIYGPFIVLTDDLNCQVGVNGAEIRVNGVIPLFNISKKNFCDNGVVFMTDFSIGNDTVISRIWDFGDGTTSTAINPVHSYTQPGTYIMTQSVVTQKGCSNSFPDTVRVYRTPEVLINSVDKVCVKDILLLKAATVFPDTATVWKWTIGSQVSTDSIVSIIPSVPGTLNVKLEAYNPLKCGDTATKIIPINALPVITMPDALTTPLGSNFTMPVSYNANMVSYAWTPATYLSCTDCPKPEVIAPKFATSYHVTVVDTNNCRSSDDIRISTICNENNYFIPNTFSPNGDGVNDRFYPRGTFLHNIQSMTIFNRWGEMIFQRKNFPANNMSDGWDGTHKGKPGNSDTYIYIIEIVCENAVVVPLKGNVTLIR